MIRRPPRSTQGVSSAASDVYKRQAPNIKGGRQCVCYTKFMVSNLILIARSQQTSDVSLTEETSAPAAPTLFSELHKLSNVFNNFHSPLTAIRALPVVLYNYPSVPQPVFTITEKAPTRAFSWLKAPTSAFTFKTLLRHYATGIDPTVSRREIGSTKQLPYGTGGYKTLS